jgi:predicted nuclease of predicted toxin-antitoxin system
LRLFLDECLSPSIALELCQEHYAVHPRNNGGVGAKDHEVLARCIAEDLVIVTENARDFRALMKREELHPGLIALPCVSREESERLIRVAVAHLETIGEPMDVMVNHVLVVNENGEVSMDPLP